MRFTPASIGLAVLFALSGSSVVGRQMTVHEPDPRTAQWMAKGAQAMQAGDLPGARSAYETALLLSPRDHRIFFALAQVAQAQKLPGKAIRNYDDVLRLDPGNQLALQKQGLAMMAKGATASADETLEKLRKTCGTDKDCAIAKPLVAAIAAGPPQVVSANAAAADKGAKTD